MVDDFTKCFNVATDATSHMQILAALNQQQQPNFMNGDIHDAAPVELPGSINFNAVHDVALTGPIEHDILYNHDIHDQLHTAWNDSTTSDGNFQDFIDTVNDLKIQAGIVDNGSSIDIDSISASLAANAPNATITQIDLHGDCILEAATINHDTLLAHLETDNPNGDNPPIPYSDMSSDIASLNGYLDVTQSVGGIEMPTEAIENVLADIQATVANNEDYAASVNNDQNNTLPGQEHTEGSYVKEPVPVQVPGNDM